MSLVVALALLAAGLALVIGCAERLVEGVVGTSLGLGVSAFAVGAAGSVEGLAGIALGSVIGATMVAAGLAFGVTALVAPMRFAQAPRRVLLVPLAELLRLSRRGLDIRATGEVGETLERTAKPAPGRALALLLLSLGGLVLGSELLVAGSERLLSRLGLSDTAFGMTVLALAVSVEELAVGNVAGSILAFFLCNAGLIALLHPVPVAPDVLRFHLPACFVTVAFALGRLARLRMSRRSGAVLVVAYRVFFVGAYLR